MEYPNWLHGPVRALTCDSDSSHFKAIGGCYVYALLEECKHAMWVPRKAVYPCSLYRHE